MYFIIQLHIIAWGALLLEVVTWMQTCNTPKIMLPTLRTPQNKFLLFFPYSENISETSRLNPCFHYPVIPRNF